MKQMNLFPNSIQEFKAPENVQILKGNVSLFLAGTIDMGQSEDWQEILKNKLAERYSNVTVINPRRDDWDSSWEQSIDNPNFYEQVEWEIDHINSSNAIFLYFAPDSKSPISLLELGFLIGNEQHRNSQLYVFCPKGFWRKGNVDYMLKRSGLNQVDSFDDFVERFGKDFRLKPVKP